MAISVLSEGLSSSVFFSFNKKINKKMAISGYLHCYSHIC